MDQSQPDARSERGARGGRIQPGAGTASTQAQTAAAVTSGLASTLQPPPSSLRPTPSYASVAARATPPQTQSRRASTPPPSLPLPLDPSQTPSPVSRGTTEVVSDITLAELAARLDAVERAEQAMQLRLDALEQGTQSRFDQIKGQFEKLQLDGKAARGGQPSEVEQQIAELKAQVADQMRSLQNHIAGTGDEVTKLKEENAALREELSTVRDELSTLKPRLSKIAGLVGRAECWLTRKDPAGDIICLEEQVDKLAQAQKDADHIQRMLFHFLQDDFTQALHDSALGYSEAFPAYLKRLVDVKLAKDDEMAEVSVASGHWSRLVRQATVARDEWVEWERAEKGRVLTPAQKEDRLVFYTMDCLRDREDLQQFFQKRGVEPWAFMLWTASRNIRSRPFAETRHSQTHHDPSVQTAIAVFRPYLREFATAEAAEPDETTALTPLFSALSVIKVMPIGATAARPAFAAKGALNLVPEKKLQADLRRIFSDARAVWASFS